mmetsp:Transcript_9531/g.29563  ORF Transcript_9531/g.29563 Transcript_9531/m.29563 type:complete len:164 (+) Transcript_9531:55-546(+)
MQMLTRAVAVLGCLALGASGHLLRRQQGPPLAHVASVPVAAVAHSRVACQVSKAGAAQNATRTRHLPDKPENLLEWKGEAEECLTWCASLKDRCFKGCVTECSQALGPPPCAAFALEKPCFDSCNTLTPAFGCLTKVAADSSHECHLLFNAATVPEGKCPYKR